MRLENPNWADVSLVHAAWWSFGASVASLVAAIVVGVYVARTLKASRDAADAARDQANSAGEALELERQRVEDERIAAAEAERRAMRARIDDRMPTVTIRVEPQPPTVYLTSAELLSPSSMVLRRDPARMQTGKRTRITEEARFDLGTGQGDLTVRFDEPVLITFTNHTAVPARVEFEYITNQLSTADRRELIPMYLAPDETVAVRYLRNRTIEMIRPSARASEMNAIMMKWKVGDIRGDAVDLYEAFFGMGYYALDGQTLTVTPKPHSLSDHHIAIPKDRLYLREPDSEQAS